jgi:membrane-bound metal-dependent hydrolase YbcI (DUF457 family)
MPVTPFHFGPGAVLHAIAPQHISFLAYCSANVLIDIESLYNLINRRDPVHAFFHTYLGATLVTVGTVALFIALRSFAERYWLPNLFEWRSLTVRQVTIGAALGAYSHVVLDSMMHRDIRPLAPASMENVLLGIISLSALHWWCIALGIVGFAGVGARRLLAGGKSAA